MRAPLLPVDYLWVIERLYPGVRGSKGSFWSPFARGYLSRQSARTAKKKLSGRTRVEAYSREVTR